MDSLRSTCRLGAALVMINGIERMLPMLPWWGTLIVWFACAAMAEFGCDGKSAA